MVLPQGSGDSPYLFGNTLAKEFRELQLVNGSLLQYVDNLLISSPSREDSDKNTIQLLNFLGERGYQVSPQKAQISTRQVKHLGYVLTHGTRTLAQNLKEAIITLQLLQTKRQLRAFLGMAAFCRIWIPGFGFISKPLYEALKGGDHKPLNRDEDCQQAFLALKQK